jgi:hypothetical protein
VLVFEKDKSNFYSFGTWEVLDEVLDNAKNKEALEEKVERALLDQFANPDRPALDPKESFPTILELEYEKVQKVVKRVERRMKKEQKIMFQEVS